MLHEDHTVAGVDETTHQVPQRGALGRVQSRRRFIEDVHDPEQAGVQLGRQPQSLHLPGGQGPSGAVQTQMAQAEIDRGSERRDDLVQQQALGLGGGVEWRSFGRGIRCSTRPTVHDREHLVQGERIEFVDREPAVGHRQGVTGEPAALAVRAGGLLHEGQHAVARGVRPGGGQRLAKVHRH